MAPESGHPVELDAYMTNSTAHSKRANNACMRCRERKVKCSGSLPCTNCVRKSDECVYNAEDRKVMVSERFLNDLKRKSGYALARDPPTSKRPRHHRSATPSDDNDQHAHAPEIVGASHGAGPMLSNPRLFTPLQHAVDDAVSAPVGEEDQEESHHLPNMINPLVNRHSNFLIDRMGRRRWLGPSSTWAYSQQVLSILQDHLGQHESPEVPLNVDAKAFKLDWPSSRNSTPQATVDIPSLDFALYLTNTVKFHLGQTYHLFDEESFMTRLHDFYKGDPMIVPTVNTRLWYIQFLLIVAFGKALLNPGNSAQSPPGSSLVSRALELLPDVHGLYQDPILSIEILCCLALYLQSVDHRNSAYIYIGQAFRIAVTQGLHREPLHNHLDDNEANRFRYVWWTLYILDRKLSSLMGAPNSIQDSEITVQLPASGTTVQKPKAFGIHIALSQLHAKILKTVYSVDGRLDPSFLKSVQEVLTDAARLAPHFNDGFEIKFNMSEPVSRVSATLNLCYHQCIILATRPLLICLLQDVLAKRGGANQGLIRPIKALLKTSSQSASKSLRILSTLQSQHLLETFLPFDLEQAFSAAFVLLLMTVVPGVSRLDDKDLQISFNILDSMIDRGNEIARFRKEELKKLQEMLLLVRTQHNPPQRATNLECHTNAGHSDSQSLIPVGDISQQLSIDQASDWGPATGSTVNGLASEQILSIADLLDWQPNTTAFSDDQLEGNWLWTASIAPEFDLR